MKAENFIKTLCVLVIVWIIGALFLALDAQSNLLPWLEFSFRIYSILFGAFLFYGLLAGWMQ